MGRIPDETIQAIRDRIDLVELIGRYVSLKQSGRNHKGLCPFHEEKTPSFNVNADRQIYHCFGCGEGGNAFGFLMQKENLTFPEAARELAREAGIEIRDSDPEVTSQAERLRAAGEVAQAFYRAQLASPAGAGARRYLEERGLDAAIIEYFGVGFAPDRWDGLADELRRREISGQIGAQAGLLAERRQGPGHYDRLRGRVVFPIRDARGRILGFGGRALGKDQEPKYLNGPETPIYRKREVLFGFPGALEPMRTHGRAVVVEGYFDVVALHRAGVPEAIATCGTALTEEHARELLRRTREVVLLFDGDAAGERAMRSALEVLLPVGLRVRAVVLPGDDDPDTYLEREGPDALRARVDEAAPALEEVVRAACAGRLATPWERADAVHAVAPLLAKVVDPIERGEFMRLLAMRTGVRQEDVESVVVGERGGAREEPADLVAPRRRGPEDRWLRNLALAVLDHPQLAARIPLDELVLLYPDAPAQRFVVELVMALSEGADPAASLAGDAHGEYTELAAAEREPMDEDGARRAIDETVETLRRRAHRRDRTASTRRFEGEGSADERSLLELKDEQIRRRRELYRVPPDSTRH
jgi:DNA primase